MCVSVCMRVSTYVSCEYDDDEFTNKLKQYFKSTVLMEVDLQKTIWANEHKVILWINLRILALIFMQTQLGNCTGDELAVSVNRVSISKEFE